MNLKPWVEGPLELLKHGQEHLKLGTDFDIRIAMISVDNSVELMIKTYLGLPSRVTQIKGLTRKRLEEMFHSFPTLIDGLEEFASDKLVGLELGDIEWFHRLRNHLYHAGNGITVEKTKVEAYVEIAAILCSNLFNIPLDELVVPYSLTGEYLSLWSSVEQIIRGLSHSHNLVPVDKYKPSSMVIAMLYNEGYISKDVLEKFKRLLAYRNNLAHGHSPSSVTELTDSIEELKVLKAEIKSI